MLNSYRFLEEIQADIALRRMRLHQGLWPWELGDTNRPMLTVAQTMRMYEGFRPGGFMLTPHLHPQRKRFLKDTSMSLERHEEMVWRLYWQARERERRRGRRGGFESGTCCGEESDEQIVERQTDMAGEQRSHCGGGR